MMPYYTAAGLTHDPFAPKNARTNCFIQTSEHKEALTRLDYLKTLRGFGTLTGESGTGKTTVLRNWASSLPATSYKVFYINMNALTCNEFYRQIVSKLGIDPAYRKVDNFKKIQDEVNRLYMERNVTPVFIFDEAHTMMSQSLEDLKTIFSFEMDSRQRAIIVLAGLPALDRILDMNKNEPLRQRIVMNYKIEKMTEEEGVEYIREKVRSANGIPDVFAPCAATAVTTSANGIPRVIDKVSTRCLLLLNQEKKDVIDADMVMQAVEDMNL